MTTVCPSCGARSTPPTPVPGEANTTESWIHHEPGCNRFAPEMTDSELPACWHMNQNGWMCLDCGHQFAPTYAIARIDAKPYGPKPAKQNGATR